MPSKLPAVLLHLPAELLEKLDELAAERGVSRSALIRRAVETMLRRSGKGAAPGKSKA